MRRLGANAGLVIAVVLAACGCNPTYCSNECPFAGDGECDDGRPGAVTGVCARGTDCGDCGPNPTATPPVPDPNGAGGTPDPWGGFGQPANPGADADAYQTEDEYSYDNCPVGYYCCSSGASCWYQFFRLGTDANKRGCASTVPRSCGEGRECIQAIPGDDSPEGRRGIGCAIQGATSDRVVTCEEPPGREPGLNWACCDNGLDLEYCMDVPAMYRFGQGGGPDARVWYQVGSVEHVCMVRTDLIPGPCNIEDGFERGLEGMCHAAGATGLSSLDEECMGEGPGSDAGTGTVSPTCRTMIDALTRANTGLGACTDNCIDDVWDCLSANNCTNTTPCTNALSPASPGAPEADRMVFSGTGGERK